MDIYIYKGFLQGNIDQKHCMRGGSNRVPGLLFTNVAARVKESRDVGVGIVFYINQSHEQHIPAASS